MADVDHEDEANLSCSSSDYGERAHLSTSEEDFANSDSEGSVQHPGIEPCQYEPYFSDAGEDRRSEGDSSLSDDDEEGSERVRNSDWLVACNR